MEYEDDDGDYQRWYYEVAMAEMAEHFKQERDESQLRWADEE